MERVYLDNAATTRLDETVLEAMLPFLKGTFGNPSSIHAFGREARAAVEQSRKKVADLLGAAPGEIFFTSGGTESDNCALRSMTHTFGLKHAITSHLEHHAVLHTLEEMAKKGEVALSFVHHDQEGNIDLAHLEKLLEAHPGSLVSLMHGNNEIGNLLDVEAVGELCAAHQSYFHSDTVQTIGHFPLNLKALKVHSVAGAAHKFHGPKGTGILYVKKESRFAPLITGGSQERNMRGGTENVAGIVGLAKALELAHAHMEDHTAYIRGLKAQMKQLLQERIPGISFNGASGHLENSLYTVLNVHLPEMENPSMLLFNLDLHGVCASGGSACSSGSDAGSHVLGAIGRKGTRPSVRFSFSKYNTPEDIRYAVEKISVCLTQSATV